MADIHRVGEAVWRGDLRTGSGSLSSESGALRDVPYTFATRFGDARGTNPEELLAAAHAACFSMALANTLAVKGYKMQRVETKATCTGSHQPGGFKITKMHLATRVEVPGITPEDFQQVAREGEKACPVSNALRGCVEIELEAVLV